MSRDPKDDIISELEFKLAVARKKISANLNLISVLERHSHLIENKFDSTSNKIDAMLKELSAVKKSNTRTKSWDCASKPVRSAIEDIASGSGRCLDIDDQELDSDPDYDVKHEEGIDSDLDEINDDTEEDETVLEEVDEENVEIKEDINTDSTSLLLTERLASQMVNGLPGSSSSSNVCIPIAVHDQTINGDNLERDFGSRVKELICHQCNYSTSEPRKLRRHFRVHSGEKPFHCEHLFDGKICGRRFSHKHQLVLHSRIHTGERPFVCPFPDCKRDFAQSSGLKKHIRCHNGDRMFECPVEGCSASFVEKQHYDRHRDTVHFNLRPFKCPHCKSTFGRTGHLRRHVLSLHSATHKE